MKTLKKLFFLVTAVFALGMIISCSHDSDSSSGNSGVIATYVESEYEIRYVEFYGDNTWVMYLNMGMRNINDCLLLAVSPEYKGTYSGNPNADGQITMTTTHEAGAPSDEEQARVNAFFASNENLNSDRDMTIQVTVPWEAYTGDEATETLTITNGEVVVGTNTYVKQ